MRRWRLAVTAAVALVTAGVLLGTTDDGSPYLDRTRSIVDDDARFGTATDAGVAFIRISRELKDAGAQCGDEEAPECRALFSAAAWSQLTAVEVLQCTRPGVFTARRAMRDLLDSLEEGDLPDGLPPIPHCRGT